MISFKKVKKHGFLRGYEMKGKWEDLGFLAVPKDKSRAVELYPNGLPSVSMSRGAAAEWLVDARKVR